MPTHDAESEVFALAHAGDPQAMAPLAEILRHHPKRATRAAAAHLLEKIGDRRAISALEAALDDTSDGGFFEQETPVSESAEEALLAIYGRVGVRDDDVLRLVRMLEQGGEGRQYVRSLLIKLDAPMEQILIAQLPALNVPGRAAVLTVLGQRRSLLALDLLLTSLTDPDPLIRDTGVGALGALGDARAFEAVLCCLSDPNYGVRRSAQFALRQVSDERHVPMLERILAGGQYNGFERHDLELALQAARERKAPEA
jgi:HEAT repeat protein